MALMDEARFVKPGPVAYQDMQPRTRVTKEQWKTMTADERAAERAGVIWDNTHPDYDQARYVEFLTAQRDLEHKLHKRKAIPMKMSREQVIVTGEKHLDEHRAKLAELQEQAKAKLAEYLPVLATKLATGKQPLLPAPKIECMKDRTDEYEQAINRLKHAKRGAEIDSSELTELLISDPVQVAPVREYAVTFDVA
jgi:hypothetical protein